ncbi:MAG TPA: mobilization protein, partial [Tenacibaculum sp.]|nr:mobilization protein [Tenacibaculum sp.]
YHVQKAVKSICRQIDVDNPKQLKSYGLRKESPSERLKLVEHAIENTPNLGFVVIDGIRDLITSINDEAESTNMASKLLEWTERYNIHIVVILHENPGSDKARGHIGD